MITTSVADRESVRLDPPSPARASTRGQPQHRQTLGIWFATGATLTFLILVVGGITRLTQSGLSIVEWDPIMGVLPPFGETEWLRAFRAYQQYPEYQQLRPDMTLGQFQFIYFWEYLHRLLARTIGLVFLVPFLVFWVRGYLDAKLLRRAGLLFLLGGAQGFMGWYMVSSGLADIPRVSHFRLAAHLLLALTIFSCCFWFALDQFGGPTRRRSSAESGPVRRGLIWVGALLAVQITWGAFVAGLDAGIYSDTFPLMGGDLIPRAAFSTGPVLTDLLYNPVTVHWMHRVIGTLLSIAIILFFWRTRRTRLPRAVSHLGAALLALVGAQYLLGIATVVFHMPVPLAAAHQAMAVVLLGTWLATLHHLIREPLATIAHPTT